jgi:hypothetical protein
MPENKMERMCSLSGIDQKNNLKDEHGCKAILSKELKNM